jgi:hypothetical protein
MKKDTNTKNWDQMTNDERLDRLTSVLTRAGSDREFRNRCLGSADVAKQAVSEVGEIEFSSDFEVQFLTSAQRLNKLVLAVPEFIPSENGNAEVRNAEDYQTCSYLYWRT